MPLACLANAAAVTSVTPAQLLSLRHAHLPDLFFLVQMHAPKPLLLVHLHSLKHFFYNPQLSSFHAVPTSSSANAVPGQIYNIANSTQSSTSSALAATPVSSDQASSLQQSTHSLGKSESSSTAEQAVLEASGANSSSNATRGPVCPSLVVPDSYLPAGEPPRTGKPISHFVRSPKSPEKPQEERVLILAANSGGSCALQLGDYYTFLSLLDKLQYGNVHGYDVLLGLGNVNDDLRKTWNKVAWMQKVCCKCTAFTALLSLLVSDLLLDVSCIVVYDRSPTGIAVCSAFTADRLRFVPTRVLGISMSGHCTSQFLNDLCFPRRRFLQASASQQGRSLCEICIH